MFDKNLRQEEIALDNPGFGHQTLAHGQEFVEYKCCNCNDMQLRKRLHQILILPNRLKNKTAFSELRGHRQTH